MLLADFIWPAFASVYFAEVLFFPVTFLGLILEAIIIGDYLEENRWWRLLSLVLLVNVVSAVVGYGALAAVPNIPNSTHAGEWKPWVIWIQGLGFIAACILSIFIESLIAWPFFRSHYPATIVRAFTSANIASYGLLLCFSALVYTWTSSKI